MTALDPNRLTQTMKRWAGLPVAVIGDLILDRFVWGRVERISPEAPVPVVEVVRETLHLGGAANVAANLAALGARPILVGVVGSDGAGQALLEKLHTLQLEVKGVLIEENRVTSVKTRIMAQHQQVCRADWESRIPITAATLKRLRRVCASMLNQSQAAILSDYAKGVLAPGLIQAVIRQCRSGRQFLAVDPKRYDFSVYRGASVVTPNKKEAERAAGIKITDQESLVRAGRTLLRSAASDHLLITRGEEGMTLFSQRGHFHLPTLARQVFDVTGAGDTVVATLALAVAAGATVRDAATLANHAAGVVVGKLGTASASVDEILASIHRENQCLRHE